MTTIDPSRVSLEPAAARPRRRLLLCVALVFVLIGVGLLASSVLGAASIPIADAMDALLSRGDTPASRIIWQARLPRALCALLAGCNLAVSGAILQSVTRNPLADPGLIGITAGAGMAATVVLAVLPGYASLLPFAAFAGAMISAVFVYAVSWRPGGGASPVRMILAGVAVNAILGAVIGLLITAFADRIPAVMFWTTGSFNGRGWTHLRMMLPYSLVGLAGAALLTRQIRVLELGDDAAATMGVRVERTRLLAFGCASLLAGSAASVAGLVGFVGLVVPHLVRLLLGSNKGVLVVSACAGGVVLLFSDLIARTVFAPSELPVGVVTGLIGGPYFIFLLYRSGWLR